jgi:hypothetical protein
MNGKSGMARRVCKGGLPVLHLSLALRSTIVHSAPDSVARPAETWKMCLLVVGDPPSDVTLLKKISHCSRIRGALHAI